MQSPHFTDALGHALPRDGSKSSLLGAIGAIITHKFMPAVAAMVGLARGELMVDRVELPLPETLICGFETFHQFLVETFILSQIRLLYYQLQRYTISSNNRHIAWQKTRPKDDFSRHATEARQVDVS